MSSYAKQMRDAAAVWLAANPDPESPFLKLPEKERSAIAATRSTMRDAKIASLRRQIRETTGLPPSVYEGITRIDKLRADIATDATALVQLENRLQALLNEPHEVGNSKLTNEDIRTNAAEYMLARWYLTWGRQGHNVFDLSSDFTAAMLLTDPTDLDIDDAIRLPFRGMLLTIPSEFAIGAEGGHYTKIHIWETSGGETAQLAAMNKVEGVLADLDPDAAAHVIDDAKALAMRDARNNVHFTTKLLHPAETSINIYATDGTRAFHTFFEVRRLTWPAVQALPDHDALDEQDRRARQTIQQVVFGLLGYLNAVKDAVTPRQVTRRVKKGASSTVEEIKHWEIGRSVRIDPNLVRAARQGARDTTFRMKHRFIVRGHYANQPHGPGRSLRKRIYIQPFWKGPEEGARLVHTYQPKVDPR